MKILNVVAPCVCLLSFAGCAADSTDMGSVTISTYSLHVAREGDGAVAGAMPRFVIKPTSGGNPTSIKAWVGLEAIDATGKFLAAYDSADGDFDADVTVPTPLPTGAQLWLDVETTGTTTTGSIALK
ncbi:MAG TPA: hypothetical protein VMZ53_05315 [Kofleriaceae bacterium]|nr:hypothetical protein [Kofleriaceae bacterium]